MASAIITWSGYCAKVAHHLALAFVLIRRRRIHPFRARFVLQVMVKKLVPVYGKMLQIVPFFQAMFFAVAIEPPGCTGTR